MGPCHWIQMFSALRPEYTCPIKLTLTLPPTEQTSLLQTLCCSNLFGVRARGTTVRPHVANQKWCYHLVLGAESSQPGFGPPVSSLSLWVLALSAGCLTKNTCFYAAILGGQGWEVAVIEGWKNSGRGVEGEGCETLTGASSMWLWEKKHC